MNPLRSLSTHGALTVFLVLYFFALWFSGGSGYIFNTTAKLETSFPGTIEDWTFVGPTENVGVVDDSLTLSPIVERATSISKQYVFPQNALNPKLVRVSGKVNSEKVAVAEYTADMEPSLFLVWFGSDAEERFWVEWVSPLPQPVPGSLVSKTIHIPDTATSVHAGLLLRDFLSRYALSDLEVELLEYSPYYIGTVIAVILVTIIVSAFLVLKLYRNFGVWSVLGVAAIMVVMLFGLLVSGNALERQLIPIYEMLGLTIDKYGHPDIGNIFNLGHFAGFCVLSYVAFNLASKSGVSLPLLAINILTFAFVTESVQRHRFDRLVEFNDIILDCLGLLVGASTWYLISKIKTRLAKPAVS